MSFAQSYRQSAYATILVMNSFHTPLVLAIQTPLQPCQMFDDQTEMQYQIALTNSKGNQRKETEGISTKFFGLNVSKVL